MVYKAVILILLQLLISSSDSEDESDIDLHRAANLEAVVQDALSKLKVDEDSHGKQILKWSENSFCFYIPM